MRQCAVKVLPQIGGEGRVEKKASIIRALALADHIMGLRESEIPTCCASMRCEEAVANWHRSLS